MGQLDVTSSNWSSGAGAIDSYNSLITDIKNAHDEDKGVAAVEIGVAVFGVVADTVAFVLNPLSKLIAAGLGWLIEHVQFLKAPLDWLAGNPDGIKALADDLHKIGQDLRNTATDMGNNMQSTLQGWTGQAADAYRKNLSDRQNDIDGAGHSVDIAGYVVETTMALIAAVRALIRDMITSTLGDIISTMLIALASAPFTFGASIAVGVTKCVIEGVAKVAEMTAKIAKLLGFSERVIKRINDLVEVLKKTAASLGGKYNNLRGIKPPADAPPPGHTASDIPLTTTPHEPTTTAPTTTPHDPTTTSSTTTTPHDPTTTPHDPSTNAPTTTPHDPTTTPPHDPATSEPSTSTTTSGSEPPPTPHDPAPTGEPSTSGTGGSSTPHEDPNASGDNASTHSGDDSVYQDWVNANNHFNPEPSSTPHTPTEDPGTPPHDPTTTAPSSSNTPHDPAGDPVPTPTPTPHDPTTTNPSSSGTPHEDPNAGTPHEDPNGQPHGTNDQPANTGGSANKSPSSLLSNFDNPNLKLHEKWLKDIGFGNELEKTKAIENLLKDGKFLKSNETSYQFFKDNPAIYTTLKTINDLKSSKNMVGLTDKYVTQLAKQIADIQQRAQMSWDQANTQWQQEHPGSQAGG